MPSACRSQPWRAPRPLVLLVLGAVLALAACAPSGEPQLTLGPARAAAPVAGSSQVVLDVVNDGDGDDRLVAATTPAALGIELHRTTITDGRARMEQLDDVAVPAGERTRFRPGSLHLMLVVPDETVVVGATFELTLTFARSGPRTVPVEVVDLLDLAEQTANDGVPGDPAPDVSR